MVKMIAGLLLVQVYFAMQLRLWSDRSMASNASEEQQVDTTEGKEDGDEVISVSERITRLPKSVQKFLQSVDFSKLDLSVSCQIIVKNTVLYNDTDPSCFQSLPETLLGLLLTSVSIFVMVILMGAPIAR